MSERTLLHRVEETAPYLRLKYRLHGDLMRFFEQQFLSGREGLQVAELACGTGYGAHLLARHPSVGRSVAVDIDRRLHDEAKIQDYAAEFVEADLLHLSFPPGSFDFTWNSSSAEHFEDPAAVITAMARATREGGAVFVGVPYVWGPLAAYYLTPWRRWREWLGRPFTFRRLESLFRQCGIKPQARLVYFFRFFAGVLGRKTADVKRSV